MSKKTNSEHEAPTTMERSVAQAASRISERPSAAPGFIPVEHELCLLLKHWYREILEYDFVEQHVMCHASSRQAALCLYAGARLGEIVDALGTEASARAAMEVEAEFRDRYPDEWSEFERHLAAPARSGRSLQCEEHPTRRLNTQAAQDAVISGLNWIHCLEPVQNV